MTRVELQECGLLEDGSLVLDADAALRPLIERWVPRLPAGRASDRPAAKMSIRAIDSWSEGGRDGCCVSSYSPAQPLSPTLRVGTAVAEIDGDSATAILTGADPMVRGTVDLSGLRARLTAPPPTSPDPDPIVGVMADLYSMLTISAALLLGRMGRTPVHAGGVVPPGGEALLLAGDAWAGKSTTTLNLIRAGWDYLSDDQVVLSPASDGPGVIAEGWPRDFHLDVGWERGKPTGVRETIDPASFISNRQGEREGCPGGWRRSARVGGLLFPIVRADQPTRLRPLPAAEAFARLVRQTPWLLADPVPARSLLALLTEVAGCPAFELSLGLDTYRDGERLARIIEDRLA